MRSVDVKLGNRSYTISIDSGLLQQHDQLASLVSGRDLLIITDENVAPHYLDRVRNAFNDKRISTMILQPGEQEKTLQRWTEAVQLLATSGANRDATLIALGGGVVGDLTGFVAACWMRGVKFIQLPTTLLAMVDSSVGGKTAVDLPEGKNLVGVFHQPSAVIADIDTLRTLPDRELRAGLAEVVKYGALGSADFFVWLERNYAALLKRDAAALTEAIAICCQHKADIVARDETETGERMLLNFGHTFGHAIETEQGYGGLLHGEAVAVGMVLAAKLSAALDRASDTDMQRLARLLKNIGLPVQIPTGLDPQALYSRMLLDKKSLSGKLRLILWTGIGAADVVRDIDPQVVLNILQTE